MPSVPDVESPVPTPATRRLTSTRQGTMGKTNQRSCPKCIRGMLLGIDLACINCGWSQTELTDYEKGLDFMQSILDATEKYSVGPAF